MATVSSKEELKDSEESQCDDQVKKESAPELSQLGIPTPSIARPVTLSFTFRARPSSSRYQFNSRLESGDRVESNFKRTRKSLTFAYNCRWSLVVRHTTPFELGTASDSALSSPTPSSTPLCQTDIAHGKSGITLFVES
jgi:hypothetical protein